MSMLKNLEQLTLGQEKHPMWVKNVLVVLVGS